MHGGKGAAEGFFPAFYTGLGLIYIRAKAKAKIIFSLIFIAP